MTGGGMRYEAAPGTRVWIDLRATGLLRAVAHAPTLWAEPERATVTLDGGVTAAAGDVDGDQATIEARFDAGAIHAPDAMTASDRDKLLDNIRGREVLDAGRHPKITFRGVYRGNLDAGVLEGELTLRGASHRLKMPVRLKPAGGDPAVGALAVTGTWEGRLTELGVKPFKALLGAIKLEDWLRLRLEARFRPVP